jgi:hypothetical protein
MMGSPAARRDLASRCRANAYLLRREGYEHDAAAYDGAAHGFDFRAAELEYDARGGMTLRQALERLTAKFGRWGEDSAHHLRLLPLEPISPALLGARGALLGLLANRPMR